MTKLTGKKSFLKGFEIVGEKNSVTISWDQQKRARHANYALAPPYNMVKKWACILSVMIGYDLRHFILSVTVFMSVGLGSKSRILNFSEDLVVKVIVHSVDCHEFVA